MSVGDVKDNEFNEDRRAGLRENGVEGVINSCLIRSRRRAQGKTVATDRQAGG